MSAEQDRIFFRNFSMVVGLLAAMMIVFFLIAIELGGKVSYVPVSEAAVAERTALVGKVAVQDLGGLEGMSSGAGPDPDGAAEVLTAQAAGAAGAADAAASGGGQTGEAVYKGLCVSCHGTGIPGIPQLEDKEAWATRMEKGIDVLYSSVIDGFQGSSGIMMPPRGGNPNLSDEEIHAAVDYMLEQNQ